MLTANRLIDGTVLYWRAGQWVEALAEGEVLASEADAKAALAAAQRFVAENDVVNPYLFEMKGDRPLKEREIIRARGPSIHPDLGKQADSSTSPSWVRVEQSEDASGGGKLPKPSLHPKRFALGPPHEGEVTSEDDDVSI